MGRIPSHRTSAARWFERYGIDVHCVSTDGRKPAHVNLSDLPEPERLAYLHRGLGQLHVEPGIFDEDAHATLAQASPSRRARAERRGDRFILDGEKTWISNGGIADVYTLFARTGEGPGAKGLSAFVVPAGLPGFEVAERLTVMAPHPLATLRFDSVELPASAMIGEPGRGFAIAMGVLDVFRSTVAAAALGFARRALDEALARVSTRQVQGAPLSDLQLVQGHVADMALDVDAAALLTYRAAWTKDSGAPRVTREAAMAKLFATDRAQKVIDAAVQLHGGDGVRVGQMVESLYREIRALRIYEGASDVQRVVIARQALSQFAGVS